MNPFRRLPDASTVARQLRRVARSGLRFWRTGLARGAAWAKRLSGRLAGDRSGSDGVVWEPLVLVSFVLAAMFTGASSPFASILGESEPSIGSVDSYSQSEAGSPDTGLALSVPPSVPTIAAPADASVPSRTAPTVGGSASDRPLIHWWDDERWEGRDARAAEWRRDWLRIARADPERVPLELWVSVLEWAPEDRRLVRSAARAADRYADHYRSSLRRARRERRSDVVDRTSRAQVVAEIERAVRDAERRAEYEAHRNDGPDSPWYRSLLRRLRGAFGGSDDDNGNRTRSGGRPNSGQN